MLTKLILKNFRKVEDSEMNFTKGLNVIRGFNEKGKTTRIEAMLYALYGAKSLRNSLDDTVTWGKPVNSLKVEAHFNFQGQRYVFKRGKSGAEVYKGEEALPFVSGQNEVSAFAATLIGADAVTANKLMLASQGNLRGALELGPKATAEMVEGLSDFSFFETLLESMQQNLVLGSDVSAKTRLEQVQEKLANHVFHALDFNRVYEERNRLMVDIEDTKPEVAEKKVVYEQAKLAVEIHNAKRDQYRNAQDVVEVAQDNLDKHKLQILSASHNIKDVDVSELASLTSRLQQADQLKTIFASYQAFKSFKKVTLDGAIWEGSLESLEEEISKTQATLNEQTTELADLANQTKDKKSRINTSTVCNHCGQPIKNFEEVVKNNERLQEEVEVLGGKSLTLSNEVKETKETLATLQGVKSANNPTLTFLRSHAAHVDVDYNQVPHVVTWKGAIPEEGENVADLQAKVNQIQQEVQAQQALKVKVQLLEESLPQYQLTLEKAQAHLATLPAITNGNDAIDLFKGAELDYLEAENRLLAIQQDVADIDQAIREHKIKAEEHRKQHNMLREQEKQYEQELKDLAFNNALLKKVRDARPIVANQLWALVLSSVSTMFSKVRGVASTVTKDKEGFKVNGQAVGSLSGSTLDLLGLSIRCSLIKLFIPNCPFLVLDEPAAAMDSERTAHMMGFVQSNAFDQVILITHEDMSELLATNVIEI